MITLPHVAITLLILANAAALALVRGNRDIGPYPQLPPVLRTKPREAERV